MYMLVWFFKEAIRIKEKTTAIVEVVDKDTGKYMKIRIKEITKRGGTFSRNCSISLLFWNKTKSKHPDDISQNLKGIKKYAAGWFVLEICKKPIKDVIVSDPTTKNRLRAPFFEFLPNPENQIRNGNIR